MNQNNNTDAKVPEGPDVAAPEVNRPPNQWDHLKHFTTTKMAEVSRTPNFELKFILMGHVFLISLAGIGIWCPVSYPFYNMLFILTLLWAIHKNKDIDEPIQLAIVMNGIFIILDIILLSVRFPDFYYGGEVFFAFMGVINLFLRPVSCWFLVRFLKKQGQHSGTGQHFADAKLYGHEDMDKASKTGYPQFYHTTGDYSHAQQI